MGRGYIYSCEKCKKSVYLSMGVGFLYPKIYQKTVEDTKAGAYGELGKLFFEMYPDGALDVEENVFRCKDCGEYRNLPRLSMYIPKEGYKHEAPKGKWSTAMPWYGEDYILPRELDEDYEFIGEYDHKCKCGGDMEQLSIDEYLFDEIICSKCKIKMECCSIENWD